MKNLYLIRGVSGAGKTTFVESIQQEGDVVVANDDFMVNEEGEYAFDWRRLDEVGEKARTVVSDAMKEGRERIFVHNTFTRPDELEPYYEMAAEYGYRVFSVIVENRHGGESVVGVPESTREKQRERFDIRL